jgi:hypothetical protein
MKMLPVIPFCDGQSTRQLDRCVPRDQLAYIKHDYERCIAETVRLAIYSYRLLAHKRGILRDGCDNEFRHCVRNHPDMQRRSSGDGQMSPSAWRSKREILQITVGHAARCERECREAGGDMPADRGCRLERCAQIRRPHRRKQNSVT